MTIDPDRNYYIAEAIARGRSTAEVAAEHGLKPARIRAIAKQHEWMLWAKGDRPVPPGLSIRAAISIETALSFWPAETDSPQIAERRREILINGAGRRVIMEDIDRWLDSSASGTSTSSESPHM